MITKVSHIPIEWFEQHMDKSYNAIADQIMTDYNIATSEANVRKRLKVLGLKKEPAKSEHKPKVSETESVSKFSRVHKSTLFKVRSIVRK